MHSIYFPTRRRMGSLVGGAMLGLVLAPAAALAQAWLAKPVRLVTGSPPGGSVDIVARLLADGLQKELGQSVFVDSKPGGGGTISANEMLMAPADGHTLLVQLNGIVTEVPHVIKVRFDPVKDLLPLAELCGTGLLFLAHPSVPGNTLVDAIGYVRANPGKVSYASYSAGTISHTMGLELNKAAGVAMTHVPYRGSQPGLVDLIGGHVQFMFDGPANTLPLIKSGKVKAFAISGGKRNPALSEVPTFAEQGFPQLDSTTTIVLWSRPDVASDVQVRIRSAAQKVMAQPAFKARLAELGMDEGSGATSDELLKAMRVAHEKQGETLRALGVNPRELGS